MDPHGPTWVHEPVNFHDILADFGHHNTPQVGDSQPANGDNIRA